MAFKNASDGYGWPAKILHWGMAALLISLVALGLYMSDLPRGEEKSTLIRLHASTGLFAMFLLAVRMIWKILNDGPAPLPGPGWQQTLAKSVHYALYGVITFQVTTGAMSLMTVGWDLPFYDVFSIPTPFERDMERHHFWEELHEAGWYLFASLLIGHMLAVLYHLFISKKRVLKRML